MFEFTRTEYEMICKECMLNKEYQKLLEMKIMGFTRVKMAEEIGVSVDTLDKMIAKLKKKIKKIL
jgi:orotate phosphoribosyltransferase-like protein